MDSILPKYESYFFRGVLHAAASNWLRRLGHVSFVEDSPITSTQTSACEKNSKWESV